MHELVLQIAASVLALAALFVKTYVYYKIDELYPSTIWTLENI